MPKGGMKYMESYGSGGSYTPPKGSAPGAKGEFSHSSNPKKVPKKGSSISAMSAYGGNADRAKVKSMESAQAMKENLRGKGC